ncbi:MAG TPA: acyltransferase [Lacunisphaera sp.]|nr:acyltransferase [Lacunisphaera sp.]
MSAPPGPGPRLDAIDAMRGYAILGVVLTHTGQWTRPASAWAAQFCANGAMGVQLFFVASALALFLSNERRHGHERRSLADFFLRRFFRVAPMFYAGLLFFLWLAGTGPRLWAPRGVTPLDIGLTALFLHGWHPETINSVVPGGWSIATEVSFYLLLPFFFRFVTNRTRALVLVVATLALARVANDWLAPLLTPPYPAGFNYLSENFRFYWIFGELPVFACGIVLYFVWRDRRDRPDALAGWICLGLALLLGAALFRQMKPPLPPPLPAVALYGVAFALFGFALHQTHSRLLVNPIVVFIGRISYSLYFVHFALFQFLYLRWPDGLPAGGTLAAYALVLALGGAISYVTYRVVELPGIALGRRVVARLEAR